jgi:hypothetical protein
LKLVQPIHGGDHMQAFTTIRQLPDMLPA